PCGQVIHVFPFNEFILRIHSATVAKAQREGLWHRVQDRVSSSKVSGQGPGRLVPVRRRATHKTRGRGRPRPMLQRALPQPCTVFDCEIRARHSPASSVRKSQSYESSLTSEFLEILVGRRRSLH